MRNLKNRFLGYVLRDRRTPNKNREHVGQNLMLLAIFLFFIFIINFAIIYPRKLLRSISKKSRFKPSVGPFMTATVLP